MNIPEISAAEAAAFINHGEWIGVGGFGPAGAPKTIPPAIAAKARKEHEAGHPFKVNIVTGASIGASCDGELAAADAIDQRLPFSVNPEIRKAYNSGRVRYTDLNLSDNATFLRQGLTGPVDWGIMRPAIFRKYVAVCAFSSRLASASRPPSATVRVKASSWS